MRPAFVTIRTLANDEFACHGKQNRMGETAELVPGDDRVLHIADYHEVV